MAEIGVTQQDLADLLDLNATQLNHYFKGRRQPFEGPAAFEQRAMTALAIEARAQQAGKHAAARERKRAAKELGGAA